MSETILHCPVCHSEDLQPWMEVRDHFLSGDFFLLKKCLGCGLIFVNPRPDENEIGAYYQSEEYISHDAGKRNLLTVIYKIARHYSVKGKFRTIRNYAIGKRLLDIGCGTGELLDYCQRMGFETRGVEPGEKARHHAINMYGLQVAGQLQNLIEPEGSFDVITLWHVLEHLHHLDESIGQIGRLLSPEGSLIVAVPNNQSHDAAWYKEFWAAYDVPRHLYHFNKNTIEKLFRNHGFTIRNVLPQKLDAYYVSLLSQKYRTGTQNYFSALLEGYRSNREASTDQRGHSSLIFVLQRENP